MAAQQEVFGNQPTATVTSGGDTTTDTAFTVTAANSWPAASTTTNPETVFRITDQADTSEIMLVTSAPGGSGSGQSWTVTRAAEGSTAISHSADWTAVQIVSEGSLSLFGQNSQIASTAVTTANDTTTASTVISYNPPPQDAPAAGVAYEFVVFGTLGTVNTTTTLAEISFTVSWNGTSLATMKADTSQPPLGVLISNGGFWVEGAVVCFSASSMVAGMNFLTHKTTTAYQMVTATDDGSSAMSAVTGLTSLTGPLTVTVAWGSAETTNVVSCAGYIKRVS